MEWQHEVSRGKHTSDRDLYRRYRFTNSESYDFYLPHFAISFHGRRCSLVPLGVQPGWNRKNESSLTCDFTMGLVCTEARCWDMLSKKQEESEYKLEFQTISTRNSKGFRTIMASSCQKDGLYMGCTTYKICHLEISNLFGVSVFKFDLWEAFTRSASSAPKAV